jgi:hypothetical protein
MTVIKQMVERLPDEMSSLLQEYERDLEDAWKSIVEGESLAVKFAVDLKRDKNGPKCKVGITFVKVRIKDAVSFPLDEKQWPLFGQEDK